MANCASAKPAMVNWLILIIPIPNCEIEMIPNANCPMAIIPLAGTAARFDLYLNEI